MARSVRLVVGALVAGVLYLLLRRRGVRASESMKASYPVLQRGKNLPDLKPFKASSKMGEKAGLQPAPRTSDSGSSHPGYPVAPAKYAGAPPVRSGSESRQEVFGGSERTQATPALPKHEAELTMDSVESHAPPPAEPWYPSAPPSYTEKRGDAEDTGARRRGSDRDSGAEG